MLLLLLGCAVISIIFGSIHEKSAKGAIEGIAILVAVCIVVFVGAGNDFQKQRQFKYILVLQPGPCKAKFPIARLWSSETETRPISASLIWSLET